MLLLLAAVAYGPLVDVAAVIERNPQLCFMVAEAAVRVSDMLSILHNFPSTCVGSAGENIRKALTQVESDACVTIATPVLTHFMAEAGAKLLPYSNTAAQHTLGAASPGLQLLGGVFGLCGSCPKAWPQHPPCKTA